MGVDCSIPRELVEHILLGPTGDRRQLQDSPILGDVWIGFAKEPGKPQELLITPHKSKTAGSVAVSVDERIAQDRAKRGATSRTEADIAYLQGIIAARLHFDELLRVVVPMTKWWQDPRNQRDMKDYFDVVAGRQRLTRVLDDVEKMVAYWSAPTKHPRTQPVLSALDRYAALAGLILWAKDTRLPDAPESRNEALAAAVAANKANIAAGLTSLFHHILELFPARKEPRFPGSVYQVSLNRAASLAISRSVPAVKADAAKRLFNVECSGIAWAVLDSGIQGDHPCFVENDESRVKASFDFSNYRRIVSLDNLRLFAEGADAARQKERLELLRHDGLKKKPSIQKAKSNLRRLAEDVQAQRPIYWELVEPFVEIKIDTRPDVSGHGTHVAGIIGANWTDDKDAKKADDSEHADGMCPDIQLYDFRVLAHDIKETEFAIIAALQYIRHMNERNDYITVHGANLSLSIPHDVRNYACGRTPICVECERLVDSGVVVVAAAGNLGYQSFTTKEGSYEGYAAFSITDPGNADGVITVGATHRYSPHTYGVSFFSSRGPTGDGRLKPDLVAPGERIHGPIRDMQWDDLDGTSMAAPHVSGAAAMLMARYSELIGAPRRIKQILCSSATDLGRERSFQGHGMLDVLRAFQSI